MRNRSAKSSSTCRGAPLWGACSSPRLSNSRSRCQGVVQGAGGELAAAAWDGAGSGDAPSPTVKPHSHQCRQVPPWQTPSFWAGLGVSRQGIARICRLSGSSKGAPPPRRAKTCKGKTLALRQPCPRLPGRSQPVPVHMGDKGSPGPLRDGHTPP